MRWSSATLGEIVQRDGGLIQTGPFGSQLHQADYVVEGIPTIMPKDIFDGRVDLRSVARVSEDTALRLCRHQLKPRTIVLPRRGDIRKRAFIRDEQTGWLCGTGCLQIVLEGRYLLPEFFYYYMEQREVVQWLEQHSVGTTMMNLSTTIIAELPVKYPLLADQERIAAILSAYDDLIENNRRRMALLEVAARQLYSEWFVRLRFPGHEHTRINKGVPEGWERKTLGDLCEEIREVVEPATVSPDTPYIGLEHMPRRSISLCEWGFAEEVTSSKHRFCEDEILFGKIRPYFHKVGIAFVDGIASSDAIIIRPVNTKVRGLALMIMSSDPFVAVTAQTMREGSKMPRADWKQMQQYVAPLPPEGLLASFESTILTIIEQLKALTFANKRLQAARALLLPRLMSGEIAV
jgi:type I restriction enzyme S subunit